MSKVFWLIPSLFLFCIGYAQKNSKKVTEVQSWNDSLYEGLKWRNIGPTRGGRSNAVSGVVDNPMVYYMGSTGGGVWKTIDAGISWKNISDSFFKTGSVGAIAISESDNNIVYVGMGEHAVRGVMTSDGDGVYKSTDGGKSWKHIGLEKVRHIAAIRIHPRNPDIVYVAAQGAINGGGKDRGVYRSADGGKTWQQVLFVDENTGCSDLSMDMSNPRILYAGLWEHKRLPWQVISGGKGSGIQKSTDGGDSWEPLKDGLPKQMGKTAISVSRANPSRVYANIESEGDKGGVYRSDDAGKKWSQVSKARSTVARAWYYIEIFADPKNEDIVYVLNAPILKSIDGGHTFSVVPDPHGDNHDLWINPNNSQNMINANDGGANISFNGGQSWSTQQNQPTAQFYRVITDNRFPYWVYGGQQDNTSVAIASRGMHGSITWKDWHPVAGGESAFIAFDPDHPSKVYGTGYLGNINEWDGSTDMDKDIMAYPTIGLASIPKHSKYRFNWNAPVVANRQQPKIIYHGANVVFQTEDAGKSWKVISPDLTRNDSSKQENGGIPFTNEGAGGEVYNTISYIASSPHAAAELWTGSDDGLVYVTKDGGVNWENVTPKDLGESLINSIELSPHAAGTAYVAATKYKFNDFTPMVYVTDNYGKNWTKIVNGIRADDFVRVVREDKVRKGLLYAGAENGFYVSFDGGRQWNRLQLNLPIVPVTDLTIQDNDLVASTAGRAFWILDDLGPLQQSGGVLGNKVMLYKPKNPIRMDIPSQPNAIPMNGQNPLSGMIIDYYLPKNMDSSNIELQIRDGAGKIIRSYSNKSDSDYVKYDGGPAPKPLLPAKKGLNRMNWNLRKESLPGIPKVFVGGSYDGYTMSPGKYQIYLIAAKDTVSTEAMILGDPRLPATSADYKLQEDLLANIDSLVKDIHQSVNQMRKVKTQLAGYGTLLKDIKAADTLVNLGKKILDKINAWEEKVIATKQETFQDVINFDNRVNAELMDLGRRIDGYDPRVTNGAKERFNDLSKEWAGYKKTLDDIVSQDIVAYNKLYNEKGVAPLIVPKKN